ncbi:MAG: hypothetical protein KIS84_02215 [Dokdonella sp.]|nr:hypothetical protein [Dokdonella sp.]
MLQWLRVRRARKAAVAAINPHVERSRSRLHGISDAAWRDPYVVGFLAMLITLVAQKEESRLGDQALGLVQLDAWEEITRVKTSNIGEEICLLSANGDTAFLSGCRNAQRMFDAFAAEPSVGDGVSAGEAEPSAGTQSGAASQLWSLLFDDRLGASPAWLAELQ